MRSSRDSSQPGPPAGQPLQRERKSVLRSFSFAWEGLAFCFSTQRHMRVHFAIMALILGAAWGLRVDVRDMLHVLLAMVLVLITEMINTALEYAVDLTTAHYDARAKVAKDVAAGAVLLAATYSIVVGALVFATNPRLGELVRGQPPNLAIPHVGVVQIVVLGLLLVGIFITWVKKTTRRGSLWRGGIISGHAAFGFLIATSIAIVTRDLSLTALALALALLVAQSRIQARIHTPLEVLVGGIMGAAVAFVLFMWPG